MGSDNNTEKPISKIESVDGFKNWLIVMTLIFYAGLIFDNYLRYGIKTGPIELAISIFNEIVAHRGLIFVTIACYFIQILLTFFIEKLLVMEILSDNIGLGLHGVCVFFLPSAFTIMARTTATNPLLARTIITYIMYVMIRVWSYAYVNSTYRKASRLKEDNIGEKLIVAYPSNVTISNVIEYFVFTPPIQYRVSYPDRTSPDWTQFLKLFLQLWLVYLIMGVLILQFILPELYALQKEDRGFLHELTYILKIAVWTNLLWILYAYVHIFKTYLPVCAAMAGMKIVFCKDWWNANTLTAFWRKWNLPVHECFKNNIALPLIRNGYSTTTVKIVVYATSGIVHEYVNAYPFGIFNGGAFIGTILEIPVEYISIYVTKVGGNLCGNLCLWIYFISLHTFCVFHAFHNCNF